jgi:hypothetical protein
MLRSRVSRLVAPLALAALVAASALSANAAPAPDYTITPPFELTPIAVATPKPVLNFVIVPDCYGKSQVGCESLLNSNGLNLGTVSLLAPNTPPPSLGSHVVAQSPAPRTLARRGSSVNISIQPFGVPFRP